jgi:hypothetical protein
MRSRRCSRFAVVSVFLALAVCLTALAQDSHYRGRKYKAPPPTSRITVTILRNDDGKPIENAAVIFHMVSEKGNMELKTNEDGKTVIDVLPTNSEVLLQVIARGYQTYGQNYKIDKSRMAIEVKLKRPGQQYSIYTMHEDKADAGSKPEDGKSKEKPSESARQDSPQSSSTQTQPQP